VILAALITYSVWFASPGIYSGLTGPDRQRVEEAVIDVLVGVAGGAAADDGAQPQLERHVLAGPRAT